MVGTESWVVSGEWWVVPVRPERHQTGVRRNGRTSGRFRPIIVAVSSGLELRTTRYQLLLRQRFVQWRNHRGPRLTSRARTALVCRLRQRLGTLRPRLLEGEAGDDAPHLLGVEYFAGEELV